MPQSIDEDVKTMTVVTPYREVWNWGRVDVEEMDRECLEAALTDRMGQSALAEIDTLPAEIHALSPVRSYRV